MIDGERPVRFAGVRGNAVLLAQHFVGAVLGDGTVAVDATMGNGHDTVYLAGKVGDGGRVYSFDIQPEALRITKENLRQSGLQERVKLIRDGHESMDRHLEEAVDAFLFNLGYLPGGDHNVTTKPDTTVAALHAALAALKPGGRIGIVVYTGHPGAEEESRAALELASRLDPGEFGVIKVQFANRPERAPFLILIEKVVATK